MLTNQKTPVNAEARIAQLRLAGLLRMIAAAENRALKIEAEKGEAAAAPARAQIDRYRQELARLDVVVRGAGEASAADGSSKGGPGTPAAAEDGAAAAELAIAQLQAARELDQARAELDEVREQLTQARRDLGQARLEGALRRERAPRLLAPEDEAAPLPPAIEVVPEAALGPVLVLREDLAEDVAAALREDLAEGPGRSSGRAPRRPTLAQLDRRPQRAEVTHAAA